MATIPVLTEDQLDGIDREVNVPGRLVRSWSQLTRLVRGRLAPARPGGDAARKRLYRNESHYLELSINAAGALAIEFGRLTLGDERLQLGRLGARWDELGLTGPYAVSLREREHTLNTFCAVLEHYLTLPELS